MSQQVNLASGDVTLTLYNPGATSYTCRDYYGNVVSSAPVAGSTFTVVRPASGWKCGWYRVYLTGPSTDPNFGNSYGAYNFVIIRNTAGFVDNHWPKGDYGGSEQRDSLTKAALGIGSGRYSIGNVLDPTVGGDPFGNVDSMNCAVNDAAQTVAYLPADPARTFPLMTNFPNGTTNAGSLGVSGQPAFLYVNEKDGSFTPGEVFFESVDAGTTWTFNVYYPNSSTLVESFTGLPKTSSNTACATINATSTHVVARAYNGTWTAQPPTDCGAAYRLAVRDCVSQLWAAGITRFEGPSNEPGIGLNDLSGQATISGDWVSHKMLLFQADVHAATGGQGKAIGPCPVDISNLTAWNQYLAGNAFCHGGVELDEISFHDYNAITNGDINLGRSTIEAFQSMLAGYGLDGKALWQTEATHVFTAVFGVHHPRRSRVPLLMTLLWEQYGLPRERNHVWYDRSHGFWSYPAWWENGDGSLQPYAALYRTLAEETLGKLHHHRFDFGSVQANRIFLGSVYKNSTDGTACLVVQAQSHIPNSQITVELTGSGVPASVTVVDAWGNESTAAVSSGLATMPVDDIPSYMRLPANCNARIYSVNDWGNTPPPSISALSKPTVAGAAVPGIANGAYLTTYRGYGSNNTGVYLSSASLPNDVTLMFNGTVAVDRVLIVCGGTWQSLTPFVDFDIQTTTDGVTWTTRQTVTVDDSSSDVTFRHGTDASNVGCYMETFWTEQWIFDVSLGATFNCTGVRAYVRATANGGDPRTIDTSLMGQGAGQAISLQEVIVPSASTPPTFTSSYPTAVLADAPGAYYRLDETSGTSAADSSGNSNTATYAAGTTLAQTGATGDGDFAISPAGSQSVHIPHSSSIAFTDIFSIEFWSKAFGYGSADSVYIKTGGGTPAVMFLNSYLSLVEPGSHAVCGQASAAGDFDWHHWVVTKNGSSVHFYRDGVDVTNTDSSTWQFNNPPYSAALTLTFTETTSSDSYFGDGFSGYLDECAIYTTALTQTQVQNHFDSAATPTGSPVNTSAPTLEGGTTTGSQIQCIPGKWSLSPTYYTYQWQRSTDGGATWTNIAGETHSVITVPGTDSGHELRCQVVAGSVGGTSLVTNSSVVTIA